MVKNARFDLVFAFAYMTGPVKSPVAVHPVGETTLFSTVFSTAVEKWSRTAGQAEPDGECSRGVWRQEAPPDPPVDVDMACGLNYHRQFAVEVWPQTFERPAAPVPLPDFKQP